MRALIFLNDSPTVLINKGEIQKGYFNPNNVFTAIDFIIANSGARDFEALSQMSGNAEISTQYLNNPSPYFLKSFGWSKFKLGEVAESIRKATWFKRPDVIRCINPFVEAGIATALAKKISVPIVVSVHGTYDRDPIRPGNLVDMLIKPFRMRLIRWVLQSATQVVGVYADATSSAKRMGAKDPITIYNELGAQVVVASNARVLRDNAIHVACINRQDLMKDPRNIIRAISRIPEAQFTLVGDGPLHADIENLIVELNLTDRVKCIKSVPNVDLLKILAGCDLYVSHCDYAGISKGVLEAALLGIPIIINRNNPLAPEYDLGWVTLCENSTEDYAKEIQKFLNDASLRKKFGNSAWEFATSSCRPENVRGQWESLIKNISKY